MKAYKRPEDGAVVAFASFAVVVLVLLEANVMLLNVPPVPQIPAEILVEVGTPIVP